LRLLGGVMITSPRLSTSLQAFVAGVACDARAAACTPAPRAGFWAQLARCAALAWVLVLVTRPKPVPAAPGA
jgi:hypothetical protein